jgi:hypothetical protein
MLNFLVKISVTNRFSTVSVTLEKVIWFHKEELSSAESIRSEIKDFFKIQPDQAFDILLMAFLYED